MDTVKESESHNHKGRRYYIRDSIMNVEEDRTHEFKGHRNIALEEIPPWCFDVTDKQRKTRNSISRNICGFLNSGLGGTVYLGVLDSGQIVGLLLSQYQQDHIKLSLKDTLNRFRPPVPNHLVSVGFIPCIDNSRIKHKEVARQFSPDKKTGLSDDSITENRLEKSMCNASEEVKLSSAAGWNDAGSTVVTEDNVDKGWDWAVDKVDQTELPKLIKYKNDFLRKLPHELRTYKQCWCDEDALVRVAHGHRSPAYVVEIVVRPPSAKDPEIRKYLSQSSALFLQPIFQSEDGSIYVRKHASLARRSLQDMVDEAVQDVHRVYFPILKDAKIHLGILEALLEKVESLEVNDKENDETTTNDKSNRNILQKVKEMLK